MKKAQLKVLSVKEKGDTWYITVDTNEEGRRILMQAGIDLALKNMVDDNINKLSWVRDLPNKKHYVIITELYKKKESAEKITGIKSYKESTQRLIDAHGGL